MKGCFCGPPGWQGWNFQGFLSRWKCWFPDPSPVLDKNHAHMGPEILSSTGAGVWRKVPKAFPGLQFCTGEIQSAITRLDMLAISRIAVNKQAEMLEFLGTLRTTRLKMLECARFFGEVSRVWPLQRPVQRRLHCRLRREMAIGNWKKTARWSWHRRHNRYALHVTIQSIPGCWLRKLHTCPWISCCNCNLPKESIPLKMFCV